MGETIERVVLYGILGCFAEVAWNGIHESLARRDPALKGRISLWMFPIYGLGLSLGFDALRALNAEWPAVVRGLTYVAAIWAIEAVVGLATERRIWDYSGARWHWRGVIRWDYGPVWLVFGLGVEWFRQRVEPALLDHS